MAPMSKEIQKMLISPIFISHGAVWGDIFPSPITQKLMKLGCYFSVKGTYQHWRMPFFLAFYHYKFFLSVSELFVYIDFKEPYKTITNKARMLFSLWKVPIMVGGSYYFLVSNNF